jgi:glutamate-ammonia-ligase adenylyltransferase
MKTLSETAKNLMLSSLQTSYLLRLEDSSPFMARLLMKDAELLGDLLKNSQLSYSLGEMQHFLARQILINESDLKRALRLLRQSVMARIILRDLNGLADLKEVMLTTTQLAEVSIQTAIVYYQTWMEDKFGKPLSDKGEPQSLIVVGMGKLGGYELNVSSDVDLIFAYEQVGQTSGVNTISNQDFFTRLGKKVIAALDEVTEDGFVFRVDMRLRPFGSEGSLVSNLDALEEYYQNIGREWERYAWIKGRVVFGSQNAITQLLRPFIFRKYLDYGAFASMRDLKLQIQRDVVKKGVEDNIKLGRGGIREIEFIAQVFQLIRGGQDASLQIKPTLSTLKLLQIKGLLSESACIALTLAYSFLRNLEHRLMYVEDQQTQDLPKNETSQNRIAKAMNFESWQDFLQALNQHREIVQANFDDIFNEVKSGNKTQSEGYITASAIWNEEFDDATAISTLVEMGFANVGNTFNQLQQLHHSHRYKQLPEQSRQRFNILLPMVIEVASKLEQPDNALLRSMDLLDAVCRRASYLALLAEYPQALGLVVKLCGASAWCAQYLTQHPIVLDELLDEHTLYAAPDFAAMRDGLLQNMDALAGDTERQMDAMRQFKHAAVFRFTAQDIAGELRLETLSDYLSALADLILEVSLKVIWKTLKFKHIEYPKFAVIGYGKLGGKELGYASDLDIIFLYDDDFEGAGEIYGRFAQRINNWFNSLTAAGLLYETDLQLRPDGNSGLLVSSMEAFRDYQLNRAWIWEHQALTRARFVAGDANIGGAFEKVRIQIIRQLREAKILREEVVAMREKMQTANPNKSKLYDLKLDPGGIVDVEFIVQYLVLANAAQYPELTNNDGNIALLKTLGKLGLIDVYLAQQVGDAYREYRRLQHAARLQGNTQAKVEFAEVQQNAEAVKSLWKAVFA